MRGPKKFVVWVPRTIFGLLAPDRRAAHTCGKGLAKRMHVSGMVHGKRVTAVLFALVAALVSAGAGKTHEAGSVDGRKENIVVFE